MKFLDIVKRPSNVRWGEPSYQGLKYLRKANIQFADGLVSALNTAHHSSMWKNSVLVDDIVWFVNFVDERLHGKVKDPIRFLMQFRSFRSLFRIAKRMDRMADTRSMREVLEDLEDALHNFRRELRAAASGEGWN